MNKEFIEQYWPLTSVKIEEPFKNGERIVGLINTDQGKYVYRVSGPSRSKDEIENDLNILDFLKDRNFSHVSKILKTKSGENHVNTGREFIYFMDYVEGSHPEKNPTTYSKLGKIMAELHNIQDCPFTTNFSANDIVKKDLMRIAQQVRFGDTFQELVQQQPDYESFPKSLIHTDIWSGNAIQKPDGEIILIDWDDAGVGPTILDLGYPLILQFISEDLEFDEESAKAFYSSYFSKGKISDMEKGSFFDAALFYALMYLMHGNTTKNWERIQWAVENKERLESIYKNVQI